MRPAGAAAALLVACCASRARADDVYVTGSRAAPAAPRRDAEGGVTVLTGAQVALPGGSAQDALRAAPGVQITDTGLLATATVRGAPATEVPVYLAGIRINDDVSGVADLSTVPLWAIERIEVHRGGAPLAADRLGIGGAIFFEPRRPGRAHLGAGTEVGSYGERAARVFGGPRRGWLLSYEAKSATNDFPYTDDRGTRFTTADDVVRRRENADVTTRSAWLVGRESVGDAQIDVVASALERDAGVPGLGAVPARRARTLQERRLLGVHATVPCAAEGRCSLSMASAWVRATADHRDPAGELGLGAPRVVQEGERVEESARVRWELADRVAISPDVAVARERLSLQAGDRLTAARLFSRAGLGAEVRPLPELLVRTLVAGECHGTSRADTRSCDTGVVTPRASVRVGRSELHVEAVVGRYARVPTLGELYGVSGSVRGNEALLPERGTSVELGGRATSPRLHVEAWAFARASEDLIAIRQTAVGYVRPYNVGTARTLGAESFVRYLPARWIALEGAVSLLDARDTSRDRPQTNDLLPYRARFVAVPRVEVSAPSPMGMLSGDVRYVHQASRTADPAGLVVLPAQGSLDASVGAALADGRVAVRARGSNLLDQTRFDAIGYPLPGRAFHLAVEAAAP